MRKIYITTGENEVWNDIYNKKVKDPCLIYGSSRAKVHIDPLIIEEQTGISAYNFGGDAQTFDFQNMRHLIHVKENGYPKYIIHSLDAFTLGKNKTLQNSAQYIPFVFWNFDMIKTTMSYEQSFNIAEYFLPLVRYIGYFDLFESVVKEQIKPNQKRERVKGYTIMEKKWEDDFKKNSRMSTAFPVSIDPELRQQFIEFIEESQIHGTKIALVYTPEYISAREYLQGKDSIVDFYKKVSSKYKIPYLDYTEDTICNDTTYFYNTIHLNRTGSIIITKQIINDLKSLNFFDETHDSNPNN